MKKWFILLSGILIFVSFTLLPSCNSEEPILGLLVIRVIDAEGNSVPDEQVFLATSYENMVDGNYFSTKWTEPDGEVLFLDLPPTYYWIDTEHWEDWSAVQTYAGIEIFVTLRVNTPQP